MNEINKELLKKRLKNLGKIYSLPYYFYERVTGLDSQGLVYAAQEFDLEDIILPLLEKATLAERERCERIINTQLTKSLKENGFDSLNKALETAANAINKLETNK